MLEGRVRVNGRVVRELGSRVDPETDRIEVDGLPIEIPQDNYYVALYKPVGVVSTVRDPQGRRTVRDLVDISARIYPVGRLDYDSEGLLLMTDDGDLAYRLTHPSFEVEKEYRVLLDRPPTLEELRRWRGGVKLDEGRTAPAWVEILEVLPQGAWVRVVLHEGRNRQIKRVALELNMQVKRLIRVREGPLVLGTLQPGQWRALTKKEVAALEQHAPKVAPERRQRPRGELAHELGASEQWKPPRQPEAPDREQQAGRPVAQRSSSPSGREKATSRRGTRPAGGRGPLRPRDDQQPRQRRRSQRRRGNKEE